MILSNADIQAAMRDGRLLIDPAPPLSHYSTSSVDLRIGHQFWRWKRQSSGVSLTINCSLASVPDLVRYSEEVTPDDDGLVTVPREGFPLGRTLERIELPPEGLLAARVEGRGSPARLGLGVHITAPTIHSGFAGPIVLDFKNHGPHTFQLEAGKTCVCQLIIETISSAPTVELDTVFQNQNGAFGGERPVGDRSRRRS